MMPSQRACGAGMQVGNKLSNGPLRAQSKVICRVFCDVMAYVSCRGYVCILLSAQYIAVNQGGTTDKSNYSSLTELRFSVRGFLFALLRKIYTVYN